MVCFESFKTLALKRTFPEEENPFSFKKFVPKQSQLVRGPFSPLKG